MHRLTALFVLALSTMLALAAPSSPQEPVLIVLYSRFYDHSHQHPTDERLERLLPVLQRLHDKYPQSGVSAVLQFSGTVSGLLGEQNPRIHMVDHLIDYARRGLIDIGYTGEEEPSYLYRPRPNLLLAETPEARWAAKREAAERFLMDFKNPVTGQPVPGLSGGLSKMQEVFGPAAFVTGIATMLGGDSPATHELRKIDPGAVLGGVPAPDPRRGIEGFGFSAESFAKLMSPVPLTSPELYWEDGVLHLSDASLPDNRPHTTDETVESLKQVFAKLDRSHVRVIKLEVASYRRYLRKRADGSIVWDPMEWLYFHPDAPEMPMQLKALVPQMDVENGYRNEEAVLNWLLTEFFPANPGSRFLSVHELAGMSAGAPGTTVDLSTVKAIAANIDARFKELPMQTPRFVHAEERYFSSAEAFQVLAEALAGARNGALPASVKLTHIYGPLSLPEDLGPKSGSVTVADVLHAAAQIAPVLTNDDWKPVPDNAVPEFVALGTLRVNAAQLLNLMAWACLDLTPDRVLHVNGTSMASVATFMFPKNTPITDQGNGWTFKPAPLRLASAVPAGNP